MAETKLINIGNKKGRWENLLLWMQNSATGSFHLVFKDVHAASVAAISMCQHLDKHYSWFSMVVVRRGCDIYVIKTQNTQKVVIRDESAD